MIFRWLLVCVTAAAVMLAKLEAENDLSALLLGIAVLSYMTWLDMPCGDDDEEEAQE